MRETAHLLRNALYNSASWGANVVINLVSVPVFILNLGTEGYGIYALLTGLVGYFGLLDLGLGQGVIKFVSEHEARQDHAGIIESINAAILVQTLSGGLGFFFLVFYASEILSLLNVSATVMEISITAMHLSAAGFLISMASGVFSSALMGLQRFDTVSKVSVASSILSTILAISILLAGGNLVHVMLVTVISVGVTGIAFCLLFLRAMPDYRFRFRVPVFRIQSIVRFSSYLFVLRLSSVLNNYFARFIISYFWGPQSVTLFVVPLKLVSAVQGILGSLTNVVFPFASELHSRGAWDELRTTYLKSMKYMVALSLPAFMFSVFLAKSVMTVWVGSEVAGDTWLVLVFLALAHLLATLTMIPGNMVMGIGRSHVIAAFSGFVAVLNVVFVTLMAKRFGVPGASAAILLASMQGPVFVWYVTTRVMQIRWNQFLSESITVQARSVAYLLLAGLLISCVAYLLPEVSIHVSLIAGCFWVVIYFVMLHTDEVFRFRDLGFQRVFSRRGI